MSDMPDVIYAVDFGQDIDNRYSWDCDENWHDEYDLKEKYIAAEKAKADKLALLEEIKSIVSAEYIPPPEGFNSLVEDNNETIDVVLDQVESIRQRIEAE